MRLIKKKSFGWKVSSVLFISSFIYSSITNIAAWTKGLKVIVVRDVTVWTWCAGCSYCVCPLSYIISVPFILIVLSVTEVRSYSIITIWINSGIGFSPPFSISRFHFLFFFLLIRTKYRRLATSHEAKNATRNFQRKPSLVKHCNNLRLFLLIAKASLLHFLCDYSVKT